MGTKPCDIKYFYTDIELWTRCFTNAARTKDQEKV